MNKEFTVDPDMRINLNHLRAVLADLAPDHLGQLSQVESYIEQICNERSRLENELGILEQYLNRDYEV